MGSKFKVKSKRYQVDIRDFSKVYQWMGPNIMIALTRAFLLTLDHYQEVDSTIRNLHEELDRIAEGFFPDHFEQQRINAAEYRARERQPIPQSLRTAVFERDEYRCRTCGDHHNLAIDHVIPHIKGGPATLENLQTLCRTCNTRKCAKMPEA